MEREKFWLISLLLCFLINIRASKVDNLNKLTHRTEYDADVLTRVGETLDTLDKKFENISSLINRFHGIDIYSILKDSFLNGKFKTPNVSKQCVEAAIGLFVQIYNHSKPQVVTELPILKMLDAWGKMPERILLGNSMWIGAYDECSKLPEAKYCSTPIKLKGYSVPGSYGSCFPKECTTGDVAQVMHIVVNGLATGIMTLDTRNPTLCDNPVTYSAGAIFTISIMAFILLLCLIGTSIDISQAYNCPEIEPRHPNGGINNKALNSNSVPNPTVQSSGFNGTDNVNMSDMALLPRSTPPKTNQRENVKDSSWVNFFTCFSLLRNTKAILSTDIPKGAITSINGIRVVSLTWVILGHYYLFNVLRGKTDNIADAMKSPHSFSFLVIADAYVSVDSFFLLSGLLVSYLTLKKVGQNGMRWFDVVMMYVHRYIRLTPTLGLVILFWTHVYPTILTGPGSLPITQTDVQSKTCYDYWWSVLLYVNNFYPDHYEGCIEWTWYLANDFQFYVLSPGIMMFMLFIQRISKNQTRAVLSNMFALLTVCVLSMIVTGIITGYYDIPALLSNSFIPGTPRRNQAKWIMDRLYVKPYVRITPYLVGIFLGYLISREVTLKVKSGKLISMIGWATATVLSLLVIYGPWKVFKEHSTFFNDAENVMYSACHRFAWSCAVAWVIYACHNKYGGFVNTLLSWKVWIPFSRLTYSGYLLHMIVMYYLMTVQEVPYHYQGSIAVTGFISVTVITYALAFILTVCVEYPISNLEKIMFKL